MIVVHTALVLTLAAALVLAGPKGPETPETCESKCDVANPFATLVSPNAEACKQGCRYYKLIAAKDFPFFLRGNNADNKEKCEGDCETAYKGGEYVYPCKDGCDFQKEASSKGQGFDEVDDGFAISFALPTMPDMSGIFDHVNSMFGQVNQGRFRDLFKFPSLTEINRVEEVEKHPQEKQESNTSGFESIFDRLHQSMKNLMQYTFDNQVPGNLSGENGTKQGSGELLVIRSGPGYREQKTYRLGPNADISKILDSNMNDMMAETNPMERFFHDDDVELFDPNKKTAEGEKPKEGDDGFIDVRVLQPWIFQSPFSKSEDKIFGVNGDLEAPRLPKSGLKSRHHESTFHNGPYVKTIDIVVDKTDICSQDRHDMKWSDWVSCLHLRMGLPRWLLAASVTLGIIFTIWVCLAIPNSAPKQRVRKAKMMIGTKELEANLTAISIVKNTKEYPLDLPPSYDDVATSDLKVKLAPVHDPKTEEKTTEEAVALPEKSNQEMV